LDVRKNFFTKRFIKNINIEKGNTLPRETAESPSLEVSERCVDVALRDMV